MRDLWKGELAKVVRTWAQKMTKFDERVSLRIIELEEIKEQNMLPELDELTGNDELVMNFKLETVEQFWMNHVKDLIVERVRDDDRELIELQKAWLKMTNLFTSPSKSKKAPLASKKTKPRQKRNARAGASVPPQANRL